MGTQYFLPRRNALTFLRNTLANKQFARSDADTLGINTNILSQHLSSKNIIIARVFPTTSISKTINTRDFISVLGLIAIISDFQQREAKTNNLQHVIRKPTTVKKYMAVDNSDALPSLRKLRKILEGTGNQEALDKIDALIADTEHSRHPTSARFFQPQWMQIDGGKEVLINQTYDILVNVAEWLIERGKIRYPVVSGHKRYIINAIPYHIDRTPFVHKKELSNGLYIETHWDFRATVVAARKLLEACGESTNVLVIWNVGGSRIDINF